MFVCDFERILEIHCATSAEAASATDLPQSLGAGRPAKRSIIQATAASALSLATKP
jgi:hypothetical protein